MNTLTAIKAVEKLQGLDFKSMLDVGSGSGKHAEFFKSIGKEVYTISYIPPADYIGDFLDAELPQFDCVWASHVLEHQKNVGLFLDKCFKCLKDNGILAITVPPAKESIVGGHLSVWNAGLLLYNLILAGFDCSEAAVKTYDYNISVIVRKKHAKIDGLIYDKGDIEKIAKYFPMPVKQGFNGNIKEINW